MYLSEEEARTKWCPFVRIDGSNRVLNTKTDGFTNAPQPFHCIATECMAWRQVHIGHLKSGTGGGYAEHGYCSLAERPEFG